MIKCTNPEEWTTIAVDNGSEEDVERYFAHVRECPFHAEMERRQQEQLRDMVALAMSAPGSESWKRQEQNAATVRAELEAKHRGSFIRTLSVRVNGVERTRFNLMEERCVTLELEEGSLIGVWQSDQAGEAGDLYLTSYVLPAGRGASGEKSISATVLKGGQKISFAVEPRGDSRAQISVTYSETHVLPALRLSGSRLKHKLVYRAREMRWTSAVGLTVALLALLTALVLVPFLWTRTEGPNQIVNHGARPQPSGNSEPAESPSPSVMRRPNTNGGVPNASPHRQTTPDPSGASQISLATVRRVYVGRGDGGNNERLRVALIAQLKASDKFTVVSSEQEADAVLLSDLTRGARVRVQLINRASKPLWFTTQPTDGSSLDLGDVAGRIVRALSDAAQKAQMN